MRLLQVRTILQGVPHDVRYAFRTLSRSRFMPLLPLGYSRSQLGEQPPPSRQCRRCSCEAFRILVLQISFLLLA